MQAVGEEHSDKESEGQCQLPFAEESFQGVPEQEEWRGESATGILDQPGGELPAHRTCPPVVGFGGEVTQLAGDNRGE